MRSVLKNGLEEDAIYARKIYCYTRNRPNIVRYEKKCINKRIRKEGKKEIKANIIMNELDKITL